MPAKIVTPSSSHSGGAAAISESAVSLNGVMDATATANRRALQQQQQQQQQQQHQHQLQQNQLHQHQLLQLQQQHQLQQQQAAQQQLQLQPQPSLKLPKQKHRPAQPPQPAARTMLDHQQLPQQQQQPQPYYYDSASPTSSFPDLSPPRDMPQPGQRHHYNPQSSAPAAQTIIHQAQLHHTIASKPSANQQLQQQQQQQQHHFRQQTPPQMPPMPQFPDDPDSIEFCLDEEPAAAARYYKDAHSRSRLQHPTMPHPHHQQQFQQQQQQFHPQQHHQHHSHHKHQAFDPQSVRWSRNNIAVTMERFQPIATPSSPSESSSCGNSSHQDYSYAYYEPGAIMCHSNIPTPDDSAGATGNGGAGSSGAGPSGVANGKSGHSSPAAVAGTNTAVGNALLALSAMTPDCAPPPPNSMRALLLKTKEKQHRTLPGSRHGYTTRYGTHENIYEDVSEEKHGAVGGVGAGARHASSEQSLAERGCTKKEFQHILNNHYRVLEELNLSVEELLMSSSPPSETMVQAPGPASALLKRHATCASSVDALASHFVAMEMKDMGSPGSGTELVVGEDSGFSGSSSGASYIGSLRNYKTAITRSLRRSSAPNANSGGGGGAAAAGTIYGSCRTASKMPGQMPGHHLQLPHDVGMRQGSFYNSPVSGGGAKSKAMMVSTTLDMHQLHQLQQQQLQQLQQQQQQQLQQQQLQQHPMHRSPESVSSVSSSSASSQKSSKFALWGKRS